MSLSTTLKQIQETENIQAAFSNYKKHVDRTRPLRAPSEQRLIQREAKQSQLDTIQLKKLDLFDLDKSLASLNPHAYPLNDNLNNKVQSIKFSLKQINEEEMNKYNQFLMEKQSQVDQKNVSRLSEGSTQAHSQYDSYFYSGKKRIEETTLAQNETCNAKFFHLSFKEFVKKYNFGVLKSVLHKPLMENNPLEEKQSVKKELRFKSQAQELNYLREDYFQEGESVFRNQKQMLEDFTLAQTNGAYKLKDIQIPETEEQERQIRQLKELEAKVNQGWSSNMVVLPRSSKIFNPADLEKIQKPVKEQTVVQTNKIDEYHQQLAKIDSEIDIQQQNRIQLVPFSIYSKDINYYKQSDQGESIMESLYAMHNPNEVGELGCRVVGSRQMELEKQIKQKLAKQDKQRKAHMQHFLGVVAEEEENVGLISKLKDAQNAVVQQQFDQFSYSTSKHTNIRPTTQNQTQKGSQSQAQSQVNLEEVDDDDFENELNLAVNYFNQPVVSNIDQLHQNMVSLETMMQQNEDQQILKDAIYESELIKDDLNTKLDSNKRALRNEFNSSQFPESLGHNLELALQLGLAQSVNENQFNQIRQNMHTTQIDYTSLPENRRQKPKQYSDNNKSIFSNFYSNIQDPLDILHGVNGSQQQAQQDYEQRLIKEMEERIKYQDGRRMPNPKFLANHETYLDQEKVEYYRKMGKNGPDKLMQEEIMKDYLGNQHVSVENQKEIRWPPRKYKYDYQEARQVYSYDLVVPQEGAEENSKMHRNALRSTEILQDQSQFGLKHISQQFQRAALAMLDG